MHPDRFWWFDTATRSLFLGGSPVSWTNDHARGEAGDDKNPWGLYRPVGNSPTTLLQDKPRLIWHCVQERGTTDTPGGPIPAASGMTNTRNALGVRPHLGVVRERCRGGGGCTVHRTRDRRLKRTSHPFLNFYHRRSSKLPLADPVESICFTYKT